MIKGTQRNPHNGPEPLVEGMNAMVMTMANATCPFGWIVEDSYPLAPLNLMGLNRSVKLTGRITVWGGGSDDTIYACPEHNHAFRAWHDSVHWRLQLPMTLAGECGVAYAQIAQMLTTYGHDEETEKWASYLLSEVVGQALHRVITGEFPSRQRIFVECDVSNWTRLAGEICATLVPDEEGTYSEHAAVRLAAEKFGKA